MTNDPKDRRVLAAAVRASTEVIVTFNVQGLLEPVLKPYDILAVHSDDFLLDQLDLYPSLTVDVLDQQASSSDANPLLSPDCCPCSNAPAYRGSPPKCAATSGRTMVRDSTGPT